MAGKVNCVSNKIIGFKGFEDYFAIQQGFIGFKANLHFVNG